MLNFFPLGRKLVKHFKNEESKTVMLAHDVSCGSI